MLPAGLLQVMGARSSGGSVARPAAKYTAPDCCGHEGQELPTAAGFKSGRQMVYATNLTPKQLAVTSSTAGVAISLRLQGMRAGAQVTHSFRAEHAAGTPGHEPA